MKILTEILNNLLKAPYIVRNMFSDTDKPCEINKINPNSKLSLPQNRKALIIASDRHQKIRKARQFIYSADRINEY